MPMIRPSDDLRNRCGEISDYCHTEPSVRGTEGERAGRPCEGPRPKGRTEPRSRPGPRRPGGDRLSDRSELTPALLWPHAAGHAAAETPRNRKTKPPDLPCGTLVHCGQIRSGVHCQ
jgi:hypothetical protein